LRAASIIPRSSDALKAALAPYDLACVSGWYSAELLRRDASAALMVLRPHLDLLKAMGCDVLVFAETSNAIHGDIGIPLSHRPRLQSDEWAEFGRRMTAVADKTLQAGVRLCYHHHMGTVVQSAEDIEALMAASGPSVHLLLDTGHATWGGADPAALAARYRDRIAHVHAKDVLGRTSCAKPTPKTGASCKAWWQAFTQCPATAWWTTRLCFRR
jgi:inosose dehydratase